MRSPEPATGARSGLPAPLPELSLRASTTRIGGVSALSLDVVPPHATVIHRRPHRRMSRALGPTRGRRGRTILGCDGAGNRGRNGRPARRGVSSDVCGQARRSGIYRGRRRGQVHPPHFRRGQASGASIRAVAGDQGDGAVLGGRVHPIRRLSYSSLLIQGLEHPRNGGAPVAREHQCAGGSCQCPETQPNGHGGDSDLDRPPHSCRRARPTELRMLPIHVRAPTEVRPLPGALNRPHSIGCRSLELDGSRSEMRIRLAQSHPSWEHPGGLRCANPPIVSRLPFLRRRQLDYPAPFRSGET